MTKLLRFTDGFLKTIGVLTRLKIITTVFFVIQADCVDQLPQYGNCCTGIPQSQLTGYLKIKRLKTN